MARQRRKRGQSATSFTPQISSRAFKCRASSLRATSCRLLIPSPIEARPFGRLCQSGCRKAMRISSDNTKRFRENGANYCKLSLQILSAAKLTAVFGRLSALQTFFLPTKADMWPSRSALVHLAGLDPKRRVVVNSIMSRKTDGSCQRHGSRLESRLFSLDMFGHLLTVSHRNKKELCMEQWTLDGENHPQLRFSAITPFSATATSIARYTLPCAESVSSIPLIPSINSLVSPEAIAFQADGCVIRLGSKLFHKRSTENTIQQASFHELKGKFLTDSWEEVCIREPFMAVSRRRVYREQPCSTDKERESRRVKRLRRRMLRRARSGSRSRSASPLPQVSMALWGHS